MTTQISKAAQKGQEAASALSTLFTVEILRTSDKVIVKRPTCEGRNCQRKFADFMRHCVPSTNFNNKKGWWEAPLSTSNINDIIEAVSEKYSVSLSQGIKTYVGAPTTKTVIVEYEYTEGYHAPEGAEAFGLPCEVLVNSNGDEVDTSHLDAARESLVSLGYTQKKPICINLYKRAYEFSPQWQEVWVLEV